MKAIFNGVRIITEKEIVEVLTEKARQMEAERHDYFGTRYCLIAYLSGYCPQVTTGDAYRIIEDIVKGLKEHE